MGLITAAIAIALVGCTHTPLTPPPQVFTFNYAIVTGPRANDLLNRLPFTPGLVADELAIVRGGSCNFTADFTQLSGHPIPVLRVSRVPDQFVLNLTVSGANVRNTNTTQPPGCGEVANFIVAMGEASRPLPVGSSTSVGNADIDLGSDHFNTSQFFKGTLHAFDMTTRRTTAEFEFANRISPTSGVLIGQGSFTMNP